MPQQVLIIIDGIRRELFGASLLARYLEGVGLKPILCGSHTFRDYYARYLPEAVVVPHILLDLGDVAERSFVFVMPSESGNGQPDQVRTNHAGSQQNIVYPKCVDRFFCWGPMMKEVLLDTGVWREDQLAVTGSPATDHWLLPRPSSKSSQKLIGITTTFRAISNAASPAKLNYFKWLDDAEASGGDGTFYEPPEHAESWMFFEASLARVMGMMIRTLVRERAEPLVIRPHPLESEIRYQYFSRLTNGQVSIDKGGTISEWLENKAILFTHMSASALDAVVRGVPVVSMKGLLDPDAVRKKPKHFQYAYEELLWQMNDFHQAAEYVELASKGKLRPCRDERGMNDFLVRHFSFPRSCPAAQQIASEIQKILDAGHHGRAFSGRQSSRRGRSAVKDTVCQYVPLAATGISLGRFLYGLLPGRQDIRWSYQPWRLRERREARHCAERVYLAAEAKTAKDDQEQ